MPNAHSEVVLLLRMSLLGLKNAASFPHSFCRLLHRTDLGLRPAPANLTFSGPCLLGASQSIFWTPKK